MTKVISCPSDCGSFFFFRLVVSYESRFTKYFARYILSDAQWHAPNGHPNEY